ncbi:hypothetical protein Tco_0735938, partial [Tanacetum coccineum]
IHSDDGNPSRVNIKQLCGRYKCRCCSPILAKSDSSPHAHTQAFEVNHSASRLLILNFLKDLQRTLLDPHWSDLELHLSGDEDLRDQGARVVTKKGYRVSMEGYKTTYARCGVWRGFGCHKGDKEVFVYLVGKCGDGGAWLLAWWHSGEVIEVLGC